MGGQKLSLSVIDKHGVTKKKQEGTDFVYLDYLEEYQEGDIIRVTTQTEYPYCVVQLDEALVPSLLYLEGTEWNYHVPVDENLRRAYSPKAFAGKKHYMTIRSATEEEWECYQNLACNAHDQKEETGAYPHAMANVVTRGESTFEARNAIDGVVANTYHGNYPYQSWGINRQADAKITICFGRRVEVDKVAVVLRGDYPHDSYWTNGTLSFSDGTVEYLKFEKVLGHQLFSFSPRKVDWIQLKELIKAEDESPFPALTQLEVYGKNIK